MTFAPHRVTRLLKEWSDEDETALEQLIPSVYDELHPLADQHIARQGGSCGARISSRSWRRLGSAQKSDVTRVEQKLAELKATKNLR